VKKVSINILKLYSREVSGYLYEKFKGGTKFRNGDTIMLV